MLYLCREYIFFQKKKKTVYIDQKMFTYKSMYCFYAKRIITKDHIIYDAFPSSVHIHNKRNQVESEKTIMCNSFSHRELHVGKTVNRLYVFCGCKVRYSNRTVRV